MTDRTVHDIPDADLLRRVVRNIVTKRPRRQEFAWAAVAEAFGLGSTFAAQLCRRFGLDPDSGNELPASLNGLEVSDSNFGEFLDSGGTPHA